MKAGHSVKWSAYLRLSCSYRRALLNAWLPQWEKHVRGVVLDVGGEKDSDVAYAFPEGMDTPVGPSSCLPMSAEGRRRRWIYLNIDRTKAPDIVADGARLPLRCASVDTVICTETLEHVAHPQEMVRECARVLRPGGTLIISVPFMYRLHSRPDDFWRFTEYGARMVVTEAGLEIVALQPLGRFFTLLCDIIKQGISEIPIAALRWLVGLFFVPWATLLVVLESAGLGEHSLASSSFSTGYAILAVKPEDAIGDV